MTTGAPRRSGLRGDRTMLAKRFFFVCAGILCLALAYHLESTNAAAQAGASHIKQIETEGDNVWVVTDTDDIYSINNNQATTVASGKGWRKFQLGVLR